MRYRLLVSLVLCWCYLTLPCVAQSNLVSAWEHRVRVTSSQQPGWAVPIFTPSSGLVQLIRFDGIRQYTPTHTTTWNIDGGKGFDFIPWYKTELDLNLPPFIQHNTKGQSMGPATSRCCSNIGCLAPMNKKAATL